MESICFVTTPRCRDCKPQPAFLRRPPCIGCDRLARQLTPPKTSAVKSRAAKLTAAQRAQLNRQILGLRGQGYSYARIAERLKTPRSTVQAVIVRSLSQSDS